MSLPAALKQRLSLPLIAAPMFLVSGPALVKAACRAGVIGSFPTANCRTIDELDRWLADIKAETAGAAPFCPNLIVHRSNPRLAADLAAVLLIKPEIVITSVGSPEAVLGPLKTRAVWCWPTWPRCVMPRRRSPSAWTGWCC